MNRREEGFLLLTGSFAKNRRPLTATELRILKQCVLNGVPGPFSKEMEKQDLLDLGCPEPLAEKTMQLLDDEKQLQEYLEQGRTCECFPLTRISPGYPGRLSVCLGDAAPGSLWMKGDLGLLGMPAIACVGSRELEQAHADFARKVGLLAAREGYVLVSGNARGADTLAQESCLDAGGKVICVVADTLQNKQPRKNVLYISEGGYHLPFTAQRALSRNRLIHSLGLQTFVVRCHYGTGGTWKGTVANLKAGWSPVWCYADGSNGAKELAHRGATLLTLDELPNIFPG